MFGSISRDDINEDALEHQLDDTGQLRRPTPENAPVENAPDENTPVPGPEDLEELTLPARPELLPGIDLEHLHECTGVTPTLNYLEWYSNGPRVFERLLDDIRNAEKSIRISLFSWADDESGIELAKEIIAAGERGVEVHIEVDCAGSTMVGTTAYKTFWGRMKTLPGIIAKTARVATALVTEHNFGVKDLWKVVSMIQNPMKLYSLTPEKRHGLYQVLQKEITPEELLGKNAALKLLDQSILNDRSKPGSFKVIHRNPGAMDHAKVVLIDDTIAYGGGMNFGNDYFGKPVKGAVQRLRSFRQEVWRDHMLRLQGPAARQMEDQFFQPRQSANEHELLPENLACRRPDPHLLKQTENLKAKLKIRIKRVGELARKVVEAVKDSVGNDEDAFDKAVVSAGSPVWVWPFRNQPGELKGGAMSPENAAEKQATYVTRHLFENASSEIILEHAYIMSNEIIGLLIAAAERGVSVKIIRSAPENDAYENAAGPFFKALTDYNEKARMKGQKEIEVYRASKIFHSKVCYVDGLLAVGSLNLSLTSLEEQGEILFVIQDPSHWLNAEMRRRLDGFHREAGNMN